MKQARIACMVLFFLLFAAFAYAVPKSQEDPKSQDSTSSQQPDAKPDARPDTQDQKPDETKPEKDDQEKPDKNAEKNEGKANKDQEKQENKQENKSGQAMGNMSNQGHGKPAGKGGHIPDDKFRASFGKGHTFHVSRPHVVNGQPTFVYGGYTFIMVDPWPTVWAYSDNCYIDYIDGEYFLFDVLHPGVRIELFVSL